MSSRSQRNSSIACGLLAMAVLWAMKLYTTWGAWGNLTIDSGHEMYVPALLAEGKQLYRDVWFMYGPAAPYFTSYLFRLFGVKLDVLYWAGSLSALGSAIFLYLTGIRLSFSLAGWTAGAVVLMEAFQPSLFCFPLPYTSAAVYGCFVGCVFVWFLVNAFLSRGWFWVFACGMAAAVALLLKPEFGMACYGTLGLLVVVRGFLQRSWKMFAGDIAATLPGIALCAFVVRWMISIAGVEFITQENLTNWPTSYFMKTVGKDWLALNMFSFPGSPFQETIIALIPVAIAALWASHGSWRGPATSRATRLKTTVALGSLICFMLVFAVDVIPSFPRSQRLELTLATLFFPKSMVMYVMLATVAVWWFVLRKSEVAGPENLAIPLVLTFSGLLSFRILMGMAPGGYPIYYNGPVVFCFLLLVRMLIARPSHSRRFVHRAELAICILCLAPVFLHVRASEAEAKNFVPLATKRGTVRVSKHLAENYTEAIRFMKEKASHGESVLSVPEDTSLYFLSATYCPIRIFSFTPGVLAPGKMTDETIQEIGRKPVAYIIWSNRAFPEYGMPIFGRDFDQGVGNYLESHYRPVGPLIRNDGSDSDWTAVIWERKP